MIVPVFCHSCPRETPCEFRRAPDRRVWDSID